MKAAAIQNHIKTRNLKLKYLRENLNVLLFFIISWVTATVILKFTICRINSKDVVMTPMIVWYLLIGGILFLFLPFIKKVKVGKLFEIEMELKNTKEELNTFKSDIRQTISIMNTNISTISSINNQIQINIPGIADLQSAIKAISSQSNQQIENSSKEIKEELIIEDEDNIMSLTKARIQIEYLLRNILVKRFKLKSSEIDLKYLSLIQLIREFLNEFPQYRYLENSLRYVRKLGNAAAHAQNIPEGQTQEAIELCSK